MKKVYMNNVFGSLFGTLLLISSGWVSISAEEAQMSTEERSKIAAHVEQLARDYFRYLAEFNYDEMRAMSTPEFLMVENNAQESRVMTLDEFDERIRGAQAQGGAILFEPFQFQTTVTSSAAWSFYVERGASPKNKDSRFYGTMIFKRDGDRWLLDRMLSIGIPEGSPNVPE
jgi:hypothetical protein